jgi:uncharacterized protein
VVGVTADTNIYISALNFGGLPDKLLDLARAGEIELSISDDIMDEIAHVLGNKFGWTEEAVELAKDRIGDFTKLVEPAQDIGVIKTDPADNRILECAAAAKSDFIITGDNHLLSLGKYGSIRIVKVSDFLDIEPQPRRKR